MPIDVQISQWLQPGFFTNKELQGQVADLAQQYPYFLPLKMVAGLQHDRNHTMRELPFYYGLNRVILTELEQRLHQNPATETVTPAAENNIGEAVQVATSEEKTVEEAKETSASSEEETLVEGQSAEPVLEEDISSTETVLESVVKEEKAGKETTGTAMKAPEIATETETIPSQAPVVAEKDEEKEATEPAHGEAKEEVETVLEKEKVTAENTEMATPEAGADPVVGAVGIPDAAAPVLEQEVHSPAPEAKTSAKPEPIQQPEIQPLYTKDYFSHQGLSNPAEELNIFNAQRSSGNDLMVMRSFGEWLRFFQSKKVAADEEVADKKALRAMWQKGKLAAALEEEDEEIPEVVFEMAVKSISQEANPATETMAKIYLAQGKWEKAIDVFQQLQLRNPQKSAYFAEKIAAIEQQHRP